jgi:hypothetical protein
MAQDHTHHTPPVMIKTTETKDHKPIPLLSIKLREVGEMSRKPLQCNFPELYFNSNRARRETASGSSKYNQPQSQKYTDNEEPSFASEFSKFDYVGKPSYSNNTSSNKANDFDSFGTFSNFSNNNNNNANTSSTTTTTKTSVPLNSISNPGFSNYPPENKAMVINYPPFSNLLVRQLQKHLFH